jgi:predicted MFS family arabinose efflux permease
VAPIFGGFSSVLFNWRFSFFCLALIWGAFAAYAAIYMVESCPDNGDAEKQGTFRSDLRRILVPGAAKVGEEHVEHVVAMMA